MDVMMESMLMSRLVKSTTKLMEPIQAIDVLALDLWASRSSILFLVLEIISLRHSCLAIQAFRWGRNAEMLMESSLLFRVVTLSVAKLPCSKCPDMVFPIILMDRYLDWMLKWSDSLVISNVWQTKPDKEVDRAVWGWFYTTGIPGDGVANVISVTKSIL